MSLCLSFCKSLLKSFIYWNNYFIHWNYIEEIYYLKSFFVTFPCRKGPYKMSSFVSIYLFWFDWIFLHHAKKNLNGSALHGLPTFQAANTEKLRKSFLYFSLFSTAHSVKSTLKKNHWKWPKCEWENEEIKSF